MSFADRLNNSIEEIKGIFRNLYGSDEKASSLIEKMESYHDERCDELKALDEARLMDPDWYKKSNMLGITMYTDLFAGDLKKLKTRIPYLKKLGISYLHLMPLLKMPEKDNDGGYAVDDFSLVVDQIESQLIVGHIDQREALVGTAKLGAFDGFHRAGQ